MKLTQTYLITSILCLTSAISQAVVSINATLVGANSPVDSLGLLVVDTNGDGFGPALEGTYTVSTLATDTVFIDGSDDRVVAISSFEPGSFGGADNLNFVSNNEIRTAADSPTGPFTLGTDFAIYWFPEIDGSGGASASIVAGDDYGFTRFDSSVPNGEITSVNGADFVLQAGLNNFDATVSGASALANLVVQPIPEPSSTALLS